ncbi:MAG: hypothetical protein IPN14_00170 [Bacteroidetes bacterium]|nr:hypothetical protein [Bacteroidota bacterium]
MLEGLEKYKALAEPALPAATGAEIPDRLRFTLTIEELIAMIKIMMDCGVIPEIKRSELKLIVRKHFESKNGNEIGDISFERQLSPTVPTISKLEDMFLDLHKKCTTLKKEKAKKSQ